MKILLTGAAGFIGAALIPRLVKEGHEVVCMDNINDYYSVALKLGRLRQNGFEGVPNYGEKLISNKLHGASFLKLDLCDKSSLDKLFEDEKFDKVVNLAAQAGVRYSITNPYSYLDCNLTGFLNLLEGCRNYDVKHLIFASSSSVYGLNSKIPYSEEDKADSPVSLYAASKKANEGMAHAYCKLYGFAATALRYFTVYGPWGRPDMAPFKFAARILSGEPIDVYNNGDMLRDFTYIDDIVEGTARATLSDPHYTGELPFRVYNIGCSHPVRLMDFIHEIEDAAGTKAVMNMMPMQPGDVYQTYADTSRIETELGYRPATRLHEGIQHFMGWFKSPLNPLL